ncbi:glycosyl transferase [bacterium]|nr:glycosyl transferase [bacterium]
MNFSVLMSIYHKEKSDNLDQCIKSIWIDQISKPNEIILVEDGPLTKSLYECINKWKKDIGLPFRIIRLNENIGLGAALNEGIKKCTHNVIARMDTDDIAFSNRFSKQLEFLNSNNDIDVVGTHIEEFGDGINYSKVVKYPLEHKNMLNLFKKRVPIAHVTAMFRKSFFEKAGFYPTENHISNEDTLLWMHGFDKGCKFSNIDIIGVKVRVSTDFFGRRSSFKKVFSDYKNRIEVVEKLNFGIDAYIYAILVLLVNILPPQLKKIAYKTLR